MCTVGTETEFVDAINWFSRLPHKTKIYVPGNHDAFAYDFKDVAFRRCEDRNIIMLVDKTVLVDGIKVSGSPWTRKFGKTCGYMQSQERMDEHWRLWKAQGADILVTHGPPAGIFDRCPESVGCPSLWRKVEAIVPRVHIFGHIHQGHGGRYTQKWDDGGKTLFANVCYMDHEYWPNGDPIFRFDITKRGGEIEIDLDVC